VKNNLYCTSHKSVASSNTCHDYNTQSSLNTAYVPHAEELSNTAMSIILNDSHFDPLNIDNDRFVVIDFIRTGGKKKSIFSQKSVWRPTRRQFFARGVHGNSCEHTRLTLMAVNLLKSSYIFYYVSIIVYYPKKKKSVLSVYHTAKRTDFFARLIIIHHIYETKKKTKKSVTTIIV